MLPSFLVWVVERRFFTAATNDFLFLEADLAAPVAGDYDESAYHAIVSSLWFSTPIPVGIVPSRFWGEVVLRSFRAATVISPGVLPELRGSGRRRDQMTAV